MIGKTISHYEILEKLGAGGMGEVYKARDTSLDRLVALKFLKPHIDDDEQARRRFIHEARAASALDHRNVGTIFEIGQTDGRTFIAMAYYGGVSLADEIRRGPLSLTRALDIAIDVGEGLAEAHRHDIVHRDVKPGNVIVTDRGEAKLVDFGLAKLVGQTKITLSGTTLGTIGYMSPEQARGLEVDRRADVWALGALLYESLVCKSPFEGAHEQAILYSIINVDPEPLTAQRAGLPLDIDRVMAKALAKDPANRFQSMDDMLVDLRHLRSEVKSSSAARVVMPGARTPSRAHAALLVGAGLVAGIAIGVGASRWLLAPTPVEPPRVRIVSSSGTDRHPVASPDGNTIAFASSRSGISQIWLKQLGTGNEIAITNGHDVRPRFSADGSQILFTRYHAGRSSLWRVPSVGGDPRRLMDDSSEGAWSPDGSQLAFVRASNDGGEAWVAGADGANPRRVFRDALVGIHSLSWSPDGKELLLVAADPFGNVPARFFIAPVDSGATRSIDPGAGFNQAGTPVWLGAGDRIAYPLVEALSTTVTGQASRIVERSLKTDNVRELVSLPTACRDLAVFAPGKLLLSFVQHSQNLVLVEDAGTPHARERFVTRGGSIDRQPVFSHDGRHVLFSSNRSGNLDLWVIDLDSGAMKRVTDDPGQDWDPAYTPAGDIIWSSDRSGNFEIWSAAADGSGARQLSHDGVGAENPDMTADGAWILYSSYRRSVYDLWKMRADGSDARLIHENRSMVSTAADPNLFVAAASTGQRVDRLVNIFRVDDGTNWPGEFTLTRSSDILIGRPRWVGLKQIAYVDCDEAGRYGVSVRDVSPSSFGAPRRLAGFDPLAPTETFDVSDDGRRVVLSVRSSLQTIAIAENVPGVDAASSE